MSGEVTACRSPAIPASATTNKKFGRRRNGRRPWRWSKRKPETREGQPTEADRGARQPGECGRLHNSCVDSFAGKPLPDANAGSLKAEAPSP